MPYQGIKFQTKKIGDEIPKRVIKTIKLTQLKNWCSIFHREGLAPPYEGGSYGNLSYRLKEGNGGFIITASNSSLGDSESNDRFALVHGVDLDNRIVSYLGIREPSSEAMLHNAIYNQRSDINAIFHGHCKEISQNAGRLKIPITEKFEEYGTIELVNSVLEILDENNFIEMKKHGFLSLAQSMNEAGTLALEFYDKCK